MPFLKRPDGASIYYDTVGDHPTRITLINGHTRASSDFRMMTRFLDENKISSLVFDQRGSGKTTFESHFSIEDMVEDILALWQHLNIRSSFVLGISMGGMVAQMLALKCPELIQGMILVSTTSEAKWIFNSKEPWQADQEKIKEKLSKYYSKPYLERNQLLFDAMTRQVYNAMIKDRFMEKAHAQVAALKAIRGDIDVSSINVKTLILHGSVDEIIPAEAAKSTHLKIKNSQLEIFNDVGHLLLAECPKVLYERTREFVQS